MLVQESQKEQKVSILYIEMRKRVGIIKRVTCIALIFLLSINSFAAIVSDNDGSAFITKAEFDALKSSFQAQIDSYNNSIDSKIDGAIAAYLSGITLTTEKAYEVPVTWYKDVRWMNDYYVKMNKRTFTSKTAYSDTGEKWQVPFFGNWRKLRASRCYIMFGHVTDIVGAMFKINAENNYTVGGLHLGNGIWGSGEGGSGSMNYVSCCPSLFIKLCKNGNGEWVYNRDSEKQWIHVDGVIDDVSAGTMMVQNVTDKVGSGEVWSQMNDANNGWHFDTGDYAQVLDPGDNYFKIKMKMHSSGTTKDLGFTFTLNESNCNHGGLKTEDAWPNSGSGGGQKLPTALSQFISGNGDVGMTYKDEAIRNKCTENIDYLMLGQDSSTTANVMRRVEDTIIGTNFWDYKGAAKAEVTFNNGQSFEMLAPARKDAGGTPVHQAALSKTMTGYGCSTNTVKINFPLYPRMSINDLQNNRWQYQDKALKISQGLPLVSSFDMKGTFNINITYTVTDTDGGTPSKDVYLSLKKGDFITHNDSDYFKLTDGTVVKDLACSGGNINLNISIPHERESDSMWLRIGPKDTAPSGKYVKINSIDMKIKDDE